MTITVSTRIVGLSTSCFLAAWLHCLAAGPAAGQDLLPLHGDVFIAGEHAVDPPPNEPKDSHAYFTVIGPAALAMHRSMRAREEDDPCLGPGWKLKRAGRLSCSIHAGGAEATCSFSVGLHTGHVAAGPPC
jgi:hypothetical protein